MQSTISSTDVCRDLLREQPQLLLGCGFPTEGYTQALCRAVDYIAEPNIAQALTKAKTSIWPGAGRSVEGGLQHVVSADNAAGYAELWHKGGSWYALTGAETDADETPTLKKSTRWALYEIPGIYKGMAVETATARFLSTFFGPSLRKGPGGCGCRAAGGS